MIYRTKKITVRLTDKEYAKLREMSETSGLKMEPVIRKLLVGYEIRPRPNAIYIKLIRELSAVGNNLNQIAHLANATGKSATLGLGTRITGLPMRQNSLILLAPARLITRLSTWTRIGLSPFSGLMNASLFCLLNNIMIFFSEE